MIIHLVNETDFQIYDFSQQTIKGVPVLVHIRDTLKCFNPESLIPDLFIAPYVYFCDVQPANGKKPPSLRIAQGFLSDVLSTLQEHNIQYKINDTRTKPDYEDIYLECLEQTVQELTKSTGIVPYDYQLLAAQELLKDPKVILESATGSGKSLILFLMVCTLRELDKSVLLIVPSINLVQQMNDDFLSYGVDLKPVLIGGGRDVQIESSTFDGFTISTWQSLQRIDWTFFESLDALFVDEAHGLRGKVMKGMSHATKHAKIKVGLTGTVPRGLDYFKVVESIGHKKHIIGTKELISRGLAVQVKIIPRFCESIDRRVQDYTEEVNYLINKPRAHRIINEIKDDNSKSKDNTLVLFNHLEMGTLLCEDYLSRRTQGKFCSDLKEFKELSRVHDHIVINSVSLDFSDLSSGFLKEVQKQVKSGKKVTSSLKYGLFFISGKVQGKVREEARHKLENMLGMTVIASYGTTSTGVNYKKLHKIIFAQGAKSFIRVSQSIGRGLRLHSTKDVVQIIDFVDTSKLYTTYSLKHYEHRLEEYVKQGFEIQEPGDNFEF